MSKFYVAEIVLSVPKEDGKRHLISDVKVFDKLKDAREFIENVPDVDDYDRKLKIAKIYEIEKYYEVC